jgi:FkbM family methyltransferase
LGSAIGVISCLVNRRLVSPERHVAIEANPALIPVLQENRELNGCGFTVLHRAISYDGPEAAFYVSNNFTESSTHVTTAQAVSVVTTTLTTVANEYGFDRFTLLCDIESSEKDLIVNEAQILRERVETLFIEIHESLGERVRNELVDDFLKLDFQQVFHVDDDYVFRKPNRG